MKNEVKNFYKNREITDYIRIALYNLENLSQIIHYSTQDDRIVVIQLVEKKN